MPAPPDLLKLASQIKSWGEELGFQQVAIAEPDLQRASENLNQWLAAGYQGSMHWLAGRGDKRRKPEELLPDTVRVISARMNYLADDQPQQVLLDSRKAYISRYALGRDYHKVIRTRLAQLANRIQDYFGSTLQQRPFVDSAPVMEKPIAEQAGLGWIGKNTLLLNDHAGSWFFLGEIYTSLPLPVDEARQSDRCGNCRACLKVCPTDAFPQPYVLDARRCISYLTIEHKGSIAEELRPLMGNRVFGCDDCQLVCPWNRYAQLTNESDFNPRHGLENSDLIALFNWTEEEYLSRTQGSAIRRAGYLCWLRNLAIGLGNSPGSIQAIAALKQRAEHPSELVREHVHWAIRQQQTKLKAE